MKLRNALITSIVTVVLQPFFVGLLPESIAPNLGFCLLVVIATMMDEKDIIVPFLLITKVSLFMDMFSNQFVGGFAISVTLVVFIILLVKNRLDIDNPIFLGGIAIASNITYMVIYWIVYRIMGSPYGFFYMLKNLPAGILVNMLLVFLGLLLAERQTRRIRRDNYFKSMKL